VKQRSYYKVIKGSKKAKGKRLCVFTVTGEKELPSSEVAGPRVSKIVEAVEGSETESKYFIRWRHKNGKEYKLPKRSKNWKWSKHVRHLEKLNFTCGQKILLKNGKNATIESIEDDKFIVRLDNGRTMSVSIDELKTGISEGVAVKVLLNNKRYKNKKGVVMRKDESGMWVVCLTNGKELLLREADMKMLPGVLRADDGKPESGKTPGGKPKKDEDTCIYVPPPPGITNQQDAHAANLASINAMQGGMAGGMSKGMKLLIVGIIVVILVALLGGAYMFMGSSSPKPDRGGRGRRPDIESPQESVQRESRVNIRGSRRGSERRSRSQPRRKSQHLEKEDREERHQSQERRSRSQGRKSHRESRNRDLSRGSDYSHRDERRSRNSRREIL